MADESTGEISAPSTITLTVPAAPGAGSVSLSDPYIAMVDDVLHGTPTHWAYVTYDSLRTLISVDDPDHLTKRVKAEYLEPDGDSLQDFFLVRDGTSKRWGYDPDHLDFLGKHHAEFGTWRVRITALDSRSRVLETVTPSFVSRDPMTAAHPRVMSITTGKTQRRRPAQCPPDTDRHPYCEIRAVLRVSDPDRIFGYAFINDKGPRWHGTSNFYSADVRRDDDVVILTDTIPVSGNPGRHRLFVDNVDLGRAWPESYMRGRPGNFYWTLRITKR